MRWDGQAYADVIKKGLFILLTDMEKQRALEMNNSDFTDLIRRLHKDVSIPNLYFKNTVFSLKCVFDKIEFDFGRALNNLNDSKIFLTWSMAARHIRYWVREETEKKEMAKFDLNSIKNTMTADATDKKKVAIENMIPCRLNEYSCENLDMLADDIAENGLYQNFVLMETKEKDGKYTIIAGHRRYFAILKLIEEGRKESSFKWDAKIIPYTEDELEIKMKLVVANGYRDKSTSEKWFEYETRKAIMERDIANGVKISGRKREYIAAMMGVSVSQAGKFENIDKHAVPEVIEKVKDGEENGGLSIATANEISKLPQEKQTEIIEKAENDKEARRLVKEFKSEIVVDKVPAEKKQEEDIQAVKSDNNYDMESDPDQEENDVDDEITKLLKELEPEKERELTREEFIKCVRYVIECKKNLLNDEMCAQLEGIVKTLENLLSKDINTILDNIS